MQRCRNRIAKSCLFSMLTFFYFFMFSLSFPSPLPLFLLHFSNYLSATALVRLVSHHLTFDRTSTRNSFSCTCSRSRFDCKLIWIAPSSIIEASLLVPPFKLDHFSDSDFPSIPCQDPNLPHPIFVLVSFFSPSSMYSVCFLFKS